MSARLHRRIGAPARAARRLSVCAVALGAVTGLGAAAQTTVGADASGTTVGEVVVTADRRATDIQRAPEAITAVPAQTLDDTFTTRLTGLNAQVPSLEITKASGFENLVAIRGIGSETPENSLTTVPGVGLFVDGVYIANSISLDQTLFDVRDVDVLRGPQGALYGQSSTGGAILIDTNPPQLGVFSGAGDASFGNYDLFRERAEVNIPLGDTLALRLSGQKYDHTGFTTDDAIPGYRLDDAHDESGKVALLWAPAATFQATLTAQIYHADQHGDAQKNVDDPEASPWAVDQDYPAHFKLTTQLYHLNAEWDLPGVIIKSVTAYQGLDHVQQEDSSRSAYALIQAYDDVAAWNTHVHNYTEELDFLSKPGSRLEWTGGLFAQYQGSKQYVLEYECTSGCSGAPTAAQLSASPSIANGPTYPSNLSYGNLSHVEHTSFSVFGQATYAFTPAFRVTLGGRENYDYFLDDAFNFSAFGVSTVKHHNVDTVPTWRLEGDYDLTRDNLIYASYARGYKPGGVNGDNGLVVPETFVPETNDAYEIGAKNYLFDRSLRLNIAAFYYVHHNFQYIEYDPIPFQSGIANVPKIHDYGIEFEEQYVALGGRLHIDGSLALENGKVIGPYKTIDSTIANAIENAPYPSPCAYGAIYYNPACGASVVAAATNVQGNQPPDMPRESGSITASYRLDVPGGTLTPRVEYIYRGAEWARIFNVPGLDRVPAYGVTDLSVAYAPTHSALRISLTATNIGNVAGINSRYIDPYGTGAVSDQYIAPFQVIGTIGYSF